MRTVLILKISILHRNSGQRYHEQYDEHGVNIKHRCLHRDSGHCHYEQNDLHGFEIEYRYFKQRLM